MGLRTWYRGRLGTGVLRNFGHALCLAKDLLEEATALARGRHTHSDAVDQQHIMGMGKPGHELEIGMGPVVVPPIQPAKADEGALSEQVFPSFRPVHFPRLFLTHPLNRCLQGPPFSAISPDPTLGFSTSL